MSGEAVAELAGVSAGYRTSDGRRPVLDRVDLRISAGELLAVLGPNGSGKTTLLRVLAGTLRATSGGVSLFGRPTARWSRAEIARRIAVLPQSLELPVGFTVAEVVAMGRIPHARGSFGPGPGDERAVEVALRDADAADLALRPVTELSGGERQRVLVAMALAQEPALLLLDEPTLHLDLAHQLALVRTLERLSHARDVAIVAVLHDLNLAAAHADRCLLLDGGRLVPAGSATRAIDPDLARHAFGVPIEEAVTATGRRVLTTVAAGGGTDASRTTG
ncbi:MAG: ABC transporter ATP-binding protein [Chloroflexi bacterium]|nr:ABC transporter ATP-binding protein [Chloroflexota bacterium]